MGDFINQTIRLKCPVARRPMKRVDRSVVLLTLSALDTLATAIGVFVLLVALLMPYYQNSFDLEATITELRVAQEQDAAQLEGVKDQIAEESAKAAATLGKRSRSQPRQRQSRHRSSASPSPRPSPPTIPRGGWSMRSIWSS